MRSAVGDWVRDSLRRSEFLAFACKFYLYPRLTGRSRSGRYRHIAISPSLATGGQPSSRIDEERDGVLGLQPSRLQPRDQPGGLRKEGIADLHQTSGVAARRCDLFVAGLHQGTAAAARDDLGDRTQQLGLDVAAGDSSVSKRFGWLVLATVLGLIARLLVRLGVSPMSLNDIRRHTRGVALGVLIVLPRAGGRSRRMDFVISSSIQRQLMAR